MKSKTKLLIMIIVKKYYTYQEFKTLTSENFAARLAQANLASKMILLIS